MTDAREVVLARIRSALADRPVPPPVLREYDRSGPAGIDAVPLFAERVGDYQATVEIVDAAGLPAAIATALSSRGIRQIAVPADLPRGWLASLDPAVTVEPDAPSAHALPAHTRPGEPLSHARLDDVGAVVTGAAVGIALTGTIVLDGGPGQGRRALTLLPDVHVCVIRAGQIVSTVAAALERLTPTHPLTWISGPSATSDIELNRVEGVHGPRTLHVLIVR